MTAPQVTQRPGRAEVLTVYAIGLFQGLSLVAFPAAATILTSKSGYDLSKTQYGLLFVPQVVMAIAGSLALPKLARRFRLKSVLLGGIISDTVSMSLLAGSVPLKGDAIAYPMLLVATATLGLGFGLTLGSISTYAGAFMPDRRDVALTALNVLLGLGTALSPFLISLFTKVGEWWYLPLLAAAGLIVLFFLALAQPMALPAPAAGDPARPEQGSENVTPARASGARIPTLFWMFAGALGYLRDRRDDVRQLGDHLARQQRGGADVGPKRAGRVLGGRDARPPGDRAGFEPRPLDEHLCGTAMGNRWRPGLGAGGPQRGCRDSRVRIWRVGLFRLLPDDHRLR